MSSPNSGARANLRSFRSLHAPVVLGSLRALALTLLMVLLSTELSAQRAVKPEWTPRRSADTEPARPRRTIAEDFIRNPRVLRSGGSEEGWKTLSRLGDTSTHLRWGPLPERPTPPVVSRPETTNRNLGSHPNVIGDGVELESIEENSVGRLRRPGSLTQLATPGVTKPFPVQQASAIGELPDARAAESSDPPPRQLGLQSVLTRRQGQPVDVTARSALQQPLNNPSRNIRLTQHATPTTVPALDFGDHHLINPPSESPSSIDAPSPVELFSGELLKDQPDNDQLPAANQTPTSSPADPSLGAEEMPEPLVSRPEQSLFDTLSEDLGQDPQPTPQPDDQPDRSDLNPLFLFGDELKQGEQTEVLQELRDTNGRDCAAQSEACKTDFQYLSHRQRTDMSLDITPTIAPSEVDMARAEQTRIDKLAEAPTRQWTNRAGQMMADGKFDDYRDDKVWVRTINGNLQAIPHHLLSDEDRCFVSAWWGLPDECNFEGQPLVLRDFRLTTFTWTAAAVCHKPLYFEEVSVEQYGHSSGPIVQPVVSGAHFFGNIVMLPYHAGLNPPNECLYALGRYRPGDCAPWLLPGFPFTTRGFRWEGLAVGAAIALLP